MDDHIPKKYMRCKTLPTAGLLIIRKDLVAIVQNMALCGYLLGNVCSIALTG